MRSFHAWPKIARLNRTTVVTEKIDGTNAQVAIFDAEESLRLRAADELPEPWCTVGGLHVYVGSRRRWITPGDDNFGFAAWVMENTDDLARLGPGRHYGEWWGRGIQRAYDLDERRFSLFDTRWASEPEHPAVFVEEGKRAANLPACCGVVPTLAVHERFDTELIQQDVSWLAASGSAAAPGFESPEGVVVRHQSGAAFKVLCEGDDAPKARRRPSLASV